MKFDLHVHSRRSPDSLASIGDIARRAAARKLQGVAITDHGSSLDDGFERVGREHGLWVIRGSEVQTEVGDIVGLFLSGPLKSTRAGDLVNEIHDQGGIAVLAHPFKYAHSYPSAVVERIDAIETANARWHDLDRLSGRDKVRQLLSSVRGRSAGSDAHFAFEVGSAYWETDVLSYPDELKESIVSGSGRAVCCRCSRWLDEASQGVKFLKKPSAKQLGRVLYRTVRRLAFSPRSGL